MAEPPGAQLPDPVRILLVQPSDENYWLIRDLLDAVPQARFAIDRVCSGSAALDRFRPGSIDICLADPGLPDTPAPALLAAARQRGCQVPLITVAPQPTREQDLQAMAAGSDDVLDASQLTAASLERAIRFALNRHRQQVQDGRLADRDPLTGLATCRLFQERLEHALAWARRQERLAAVMLLNLDRFREVNERLGHERGDRALALIGRRLTRRLRETDTVARLGGDRFALVIEDLGQAAHARQVADKLLAAIRPPLRIDDAELALRASLGVALYPEHGVSAPALRQQAEKAMHRARAAGGDRCCCAGAPDPGRPQAEPPGAATPAGRAIAARPAAFSLAYQPQISLVGGPPALAASLVWPPAAASDAIVDAAALPAGDVLAAWDERLRAVAIGHLADWLARGVALAHLALPLLAPRQLDDSLLAAWSQGLARAGIGRERIEFEIDEELFPALAADGAAPLRRVTAAGFRLALTGFGRRLGVLSGLQLGLLHSLKLAPEFHRPASRDASAAQVLRTVMAMARGLGLRVVADGVSDDDGFALLRREGCAAVQGLMNSRPLSPQACAAWLGRSRRPPARELPAGRSPAAPASQPRRASQR